jgi:dipeptide/tripeptide permease
MTTDAAPDETARLRARQKTMLYLAIGLLTACAIALVALPLHRVPFFARMLLAAFDLVIAAVLWVFGRQHLAKK